MSKCSFLMTSWRIVRPLRWIMMNLLWHKEIQWWLFLCVILTGPQHTQIGGETLFLDLSVRVFAEQISVWIVKLRKVNSVPGVGIIQSTEGLKRTKRQKKVEWILIARAKEWIFCGPQGSQFSGLQSWTRIYTVGSLAPRFSHYTTDFLGFLSCTQ